MAHGRRAQTVAGMIVVFCCLLLGALIGVVLAGVGPLGAPLHGLVGVVQTAGSQAAERLADLLPFLPPTLVTLSGQLFALLAPGMLVLLLVEALVAGVRLRRMAAVTLLGLGGLSFLVLPAGQALVLLALATVAATLLCFSGALVLAPVAAVTGWFAGGYAAGLARGTDPAVTAATETLTTLFPLGEAAGWALTGAAAAPLLAAAVRVLRGS